MRRPLAWALSVLTSMVAAIAVLTPAPAQASPLCDYINSCGRIIVSTSSRGSVPIVKNWQWSQYSTVTFASVPYAQRLYLAPGVDSVNVWKDVDGLMTRPECVTTARTISQVRMGMPGQVLTPGKAFKISDGNTLYVSANGTNCRG